MQQRLPFAIRPRTPAGKGAPGGSYGGIDVRRVAGGHLCKGGSGQPG